jgi:uncharacterized protein (TIGR03083 family)
LSADIETLYLDAQRSFVEFTRHLTDDDWATPVPCCAGWTVRDVLSHVSGIPDDAMAGRLDGVASPEWTASQVERNRGCTVEELLDRWSAQSPIFASVLGSGGDDRPPFDCHTHEHDIRHALGRPGNRDSTIVQAAAERLVAQLNESHSLVVEIAPASTDGTEPSRPAHSVSLSAVTDFEIFRSRLGRRSLQQVEQYAWSGPVERIAAVIADWFVFGPTTVDIVEP